MGVLAGAPVAAGSPSDSSGSPGSAEASGSATSTADSAPSTADAAPAERTPRGAKSGDTDRSRSIDDRRSARAAARGDVRGTDNEFTWRWRNHADKDSLTEERSESAGPVERPAPVTPADEAPATHSDEQTAAALPSAQTLAEAPPGAGTVTLRSVVSARPVTVASIVTDTLTWVGLGRFADGLPLPASPVSSVLEALWLAVRQSQYTWNNQRPRSEVTTSGPGPDGTVTGALNAVDYDDVALTYSLHAGPKYGTVVLDGVGGFTYIPDGSGRADTFTVTIDDTVGNPFHVHGLLGALGLAVPTRVVVSIAGNIAPADLNEVAVVTDAKGRVKAIDGRFTDRKVGSAADAAAVLNDMAATLGIAEHFARTAHITTSRVGVGSTAEIIYRVTEFVAGIEVIGSDVILVTDIHGAVTGLFNNYRGVGESFGVTPDATLDEADEIRRLIRARYPEKSLRSSELIIYALDDDNPRLAWRVVVERSARHMLVPSGAVVVFHADGPYVGEVIVTNTAASAFEVTGYARDWLGDYRAINTTMRRTPWYVVREMYDTTRNIATYRTSYPLWGLAGPALPGRVVTRGWLGWDRGAVSAHANAAAVYDYFATVLGRTSFDDKGALIEISIRYAPLLSRTYANAFWDPIAQQFVFGNRGRLEAALDIVGHEFTHAVVTSVVGGGKPVLYHGESGALNEAYADILGMLIEGKQGRGRWLIGEDSLLGAIRNLADPKSIRTSLGPYRAHYDDRYTGSGDNYGEHINSTIFSHAVYRMMVDPANIGVTDEMWATVFYQSLSRLGATSKFPEGRAAVVNTSRALNFSSAQVAAIEQAFDAVGITAVSAPLSLVA